MGHGCREEPIWTTPVVVVRRSLSWRRQIAPMPLTEDRLREIQQDYFAEDVPVDVAVMSTWTEDEAIAYFDSGGVTKPGAAALQGLFALPPLKLIEGGELEMSSIAGKPAFMMNVASR